MNQASKQAPARLRSAQARQRGVALIFGMLILLILTIIGITAVRTTTQQERMAAASQQQSQVFETAESTIQFVMSQIMTEAGVPANPQYAALLTQAVSNGMNFQGSPEPMVPTISSTGTVGNPVITITPTASAGDSKIATSARLYWVNTVCPGFSGTNLNKFSPYGFVIDATATDATGASARNIQQVCVLAPKTS